MQAAKVLWYKELGNNKGNADLHEDKSLRYANWKNRTTIVLGLPSHSWIVEALDSILLRKDSTCC